MPCLPPPGPLLCPLGLHTHVATGPLHMRGIPPHVPSPLPQALPQLPVVMMRDRADTDADLGTRPPLLLLLPPLGAALGLSMAGSLVAPSRRPRPVSKARGVECRAPVLLLRSRAWLRPTGSAVGNWVRGALSPASPYNTWSSPWAPHTSGLLAFIPAEPSPYTPFPSCSNLSSDRPPPTPLLNLWLPLLGLTRLQPSPGGVTP